VSSDKERQPSLQPNLAGQDEEYSMYLLAGDNILHSTGQVNTKERVFHVRTESDP
jgi:hypothetical protein